MLSGIHSHMTALLSCVKNRLLCLSACMSCEVLESHGALAKTKTKKIPTVFWKISAAYLHGSFFTFLPPVLYISKGM